MYITIRAIRNYGDMVPAGLIVEPAQIRRFKDKVRDGKIVEITDYNKQRYNDYVTRMLGREFDVDTAEKYTCKYYCAAETAETAETTETAEMAETAETAAPQKVAAVVKPKVVAAVSKEA